MIRRYHDTMGQGALPKRMVVIAALAVMLTGCAAGDVENGVLGSAKAWCRNTPQSCSVHDQLR